MTHDNVIQVVSSWFKQRNDVNLVSRFSYDFPSPDVQIELKNKKRICVECKPSNAVKREYLTGLGQAVAYLKIADLSYLALPEKEMSEMKEYFWLDFIGLLAVDNSSIKEIRQPKIANIQQIEKSEIKRAYAYYRDLTPNDIYYILKTIQSFQLKNACIKEIREGMWKSITSTREWNKSKSSHLANISLFLRDMKLINLNDYKLQKNADELLLYGDNENWSSFNHLLTKYFLIDGNYIDIIALIQELNDLKFQFSSVNEFRELLCSKIFEEKLASGGTDVNRDLNDILRILRELNILSDWTKVNMFGGKYNVIWKNVLPYIKYR